MIDAAEHRVIDCDWHYQGSFEEVAEYMDEPWRTKYKRSNWGDSGVKQNLSSFFPMSTGDRQAYEKVVREHSNYPDKTEIPDQGGHGVP
ncbi:hypothetical protein [Natronorubrum sp. FCH18a]|uniref:hypothetical protein n=1 Tax=Natronorubrum sp. FCH18a TaxID=3447018 RepID=UPI003F510194